MPNQISPGSRTSLMSNVSPFTRLISTLPGRRHRLKTGQLNEIPTETHDIWSFLLLDLSIKDGRASDLTDRFSRSIKEPLTRKKTEEKRCRHGIKDRKLLHFFRQLPYFLFFFLSAFILIIAKRNKGHIGGRKKIK